MSLRLFAPALFLLAVTFSPAASAARIDDQFRAWLTNDLWPEAKANGISQKTFDAAFAGVQPNLKLPDLVMPGEKPKTPKKQHQAEFGSPGSYFAEKTVKAVTAGGRTRIAGAISGAIIVVAVLELTRFAFAALPGLDAVRHASLREVAIALSLIFILQRRPQGLFGIKNESSRSGGAGEKQLESTS